MEDFEMYLEKINGPEDVKKLTVKEMTSLAEEMRTALLKRASIHGGHFGPNFGMVEATIALHYVFDSPKDKIVYDVSHQTYPHKMLTGRKDAYIYEEHYDDVSGYSNPHESEHDHFIIGHTSTSVSLACGLAKARDLNGEKGNVIAVIGDGSLSGGEALEGFDYAVELEGNLIIVVNDNDMSIAENHGGLYGNLKLLRETCFVALFEYFKVPLLITISPIICPLPEKFAPFFASTPYSFVFSFAKTPIGITTLNTIVMTVAIATIFFTLFITSSFQFYRSLLYTYLRIKKTATP
jgi:deoxyxylulose-5-phosphate synthase